MTTVDTPPPAVSFRVRLIYRQWYVRLYADMTCGDCVDSIGPFDDRDQAEAHGHSLGLPDGDKGHG